MPQSNRTRIGIAAVIGAAILACGGGLVLLGWMIDETHFDRPTAAFDALGADIAAVAGVEALEKERWVEAPTFSDPSSWISVTADAAALPAVVEVACTSGHPEAVQWEFQLETASDGLVSLFSDPVDVCPTFGFEAPSLVGALDRVVPGATVQAVTGDDGRFALSSIDAQLDELIPLVAQVDAVREAAGLASGVLTDVGGATLGVEVRADEGAAYGTLLRRLSSEHGVTGFFVGGSGTPIDGVDKVQVVAPADEHRAIVTAIEASGLPIAGLPVTFLPE
ncbi:MULTISPECIES: hypothetical protein [Microbacterium]|uniref:hypothetical protein n=1 Tax=Microbacterium TaxID=33882 RepID=UPI00278927A2|nr:MULTISPECIES: hypothetical protein [Microbacterium]MDQ1084731.1 hypothetical protein [Microbacterium sp. SORGH_AS_0344]MDQ1169992.1 hypothetical protein [Microbacterium proteolyticum]